MREFFGPELYEKYLCNALARLDIIKDFEILKRSAHGTDDYCYLFVLYWIVTLGSSKEAQMNEL